MNTSSVQSDEGFTLVEVLAAFLILSLSLATLYQSFVVSTRGEMRVHEKQTALLLAEGLLDRVGRDIVLLPGKKMGDFETKGYRWEVSVKTSSLVEGDDRRRRGFFPYEVKIRVYGPRGEKELVMLETLKLGER